MASSSSTQTSPPSNEANNVLTIPDIINSIPNLIHLLSEAKRAIPSPPSITSIAANNNNSIAPDVGNISVPPSNGSVPQATPTAATTDNSNNSGNNTANNGGSSAYTHSRHEDHQKLRNQLERLEKDLNFIQISFGKLKNLEVNVSKQFMILQKQGDILSSVVEYINQPQNEITAFPRKRFHANIKAISDMVMKLKLQIPSPHKMNLATEGHRNIEAVSGLDARNLIDEMLELPANKNFQSCSAFKDFEQIYSGLDSSYKLCLLCFAVFPEGAVVKKRLLMYWWIGEGLIDSGRNGRNEPPSGGNEVRKANTAEEVAYGILKKFLEKGIIEPVLKKRRLIGFRMQVWIRYAVISHAKKAGFFSFDGMGNPTAEFSSCQRACLVKTEEGYSRSVFMKSNVNSQNNAHPEPEKLQLEKLRTLFNVNDPYPDFEMQSLLRMKNVNVLCLGRWDNSSKKHTEDEESMRHIEVEGIEFLKGLKNMKYLKYLSLQGVSRVNMLPDTVWNLPNLMILDLNACHNLEVLPDKIGSLKNLTHLDISECYLLDSMPKGLGSLTKLEVLKGFVISDLKIKNSGTLDDLAGLAKLRKLSIYTMKKDFPTGQELDVLQRITGLRKLRIEWGGKSLEKSMTDTSPSVKKKYGRATAFKQDNDSAMYPELPKDLEKLDLQCYPENKAPSWLMPNKLERLRKLYVRGGNLSGLGQAHGGDDKWKVKILQVKFLSELKMEWRQLRNAFPDLIYLEKVKCPKLTFFPCDESGVWLNRKLLQSDKKLLEELEFGWSFLATRSVCK